MNALGGRGGGRGAPLRVMLPRARGWRGAIVGGLKLGALVIPCTASLRAKDIAYRARHSGARAIVTTVEQIPEVEQALAEVPGVTIRVALGGAPAGWHDLETTIDRAASTGVPARPPRGLGLLCAAHRVSAAREAGSRALAIAAPAALRRCR